MACEPDEADLTLPGGAGAALHLKRMVPRGFSGDHGLRGWRAGVG